MAAMGWRQEEQEDEEKLTDSTHGRFGKMVRCKHIDVQKERRQSVN